MKTILAIGAILDAVFASPVVDSADSTQPHLFVFGDSYTATCFNINGTLPSDKDPLGNPQAGSCTSSGGLVWPEWLTLKYNTTLVLTYDFAVSGASITDSFDQQILFDYEPKFAAMRGKEWTSKNSIFASWIGINDINWQSILFSANHKSDFHKTFPPRMDLYFELMDSLYNTGARNYFFVNMPPLNRAPMIAETNTSVINNYKQGVAYFNQELLPDYVQNFTETHSGVKAAIYDAHAIFTKVLNAPHDYGYKNNYCYGTEGCFWANNYHPVDTMQQRIASDMVPDLISLGWPELVL